MARGIGLILVAVLLGVVLLRATDSPEPFEPRVTSTAERPEGTPGEEEEDPAAPPTTVAQARNPAEVSILVANGSGVAGAGGRITETLGGSNYVLKDPTNTTSPAETSAVYFVEGYEADAKAVAQLLTPVPAALPMPDPVPVKDLAGANILVVVAADLAAG